MRLIIISTLFVFFFGNVNSFALKSNPLKSKHEFRSALSSQLMTTQMVTEHVTVGAPFVAQIVLCSSVVVTGASVSMNPALSSEVEVENKEFDIYRDSILRYAGYFNEVGEAFRPLVPLPLVLTSYAAAISYVFADAISKGINTNKKFDGEGRCGLAAVIDTLTFQFLASIIFPGYIINRWVALSDFLVNDVIDVSKMLSQNFGLDASEKFSLAQYGLGDLALSADQIASSIPTALGLALIPLIVSPLDALTEKILDDIVRPQLKRAFPSCDL